MSVSVRYLGRKGAILFLVGLVWVARGLLLPITDGPYPANSGLPHLFVLSFEARQGLWIATGALAIGGALLWWPRFERWAFGAAALGPLLMMTSYLWGFGVWVYGNLAGTSVGYASGLGEATVWAMVIGILLLVGGWPEARVTVPVLPVTQPVTGEGQDAP